MNRARYRFPLIMLAMLIIWYCSQPTPFYQSLKITSTADSISYLEIDTLNTTYLTGAFTWEFWFRVGDLTLDSPCLLMVPDAGNNNDLAIFIDRATGKTVTVFFAGHQLTAKTSTSLLDGQFHAIALANDATGRLVLFVDGSRKLVKVHTWRLNPTGRNILIGGDWDPGQTIPDNGWTGWLDEVRLWDTALADSELAYHGKHIEKLTQHYNPDLLRHLKVLWRFNTEDKTLTVVADEHPGGGERPSLILHGETSWTEAAAR